MHFNLKNPTSYEARIKQLELCIPNFFDYGNYLYIGASKGRTHFLEFLTGKNTTVLEIYQPNIDELEKRLESMKFILGDVREIEKYLANKSQDVIFWYHGPEHLHHHEIRPTLQKLEMIAAKLVVFGCPWGIYEQGTYDGNIHEAHLSSLYPDFFVDMGYQVCTLGAKDTMGSNILSWRRLNDYDEHAVRSQANSIINP